MNSNLVLPSSVVQTPCLHLDHATVQTLLTLQGPSLGLWRAAEIAALREQVFEPPVLDLGCGDGLVTSMVLSTVEIALDPDAQALEKATQKGVYTRSLAVAMEDCPLANESISTVISNSVLEHIPNIDEVLQTIARLLKPNGTLVFTVPTEAFSDWLALPFAPYARWRNQTLQHLNLWSIAEWTEHLEQAGFTVETVRPYLAQTWVNLWDWLELLQQIKLGQRRLFGLVWRKLPPDWMEFLAQWAATIDLSTTEPGGGRLIVARKRE